MSRGLVVAVYFVLVFISIGAPARASEPAAQAAAASVDFNGDGFDDLAVGVPGEGLGGVAGAGAVHVLYGSSRGLRATASQLWTQDAPGVAGIAEAEEWFGWSAAAADFDGDGFSDLAVGVPSEDIGSTVYGGVVHVLYGSPGGLRAAGSQVLSQNTPGIGGSAEGGGFGWTLVAANFGRGSQADLAVGAPSQRLAGAAEGSGVVHVLYGSGAGLSARGSQLWSQDSPGIRGGAELDDVFGRSLAAGNLGKSSTDDLIIGVPWEDLGPADDAGAVHVLYGTTNGLTAAGSQFWTQDSRGVAGRTENLDAFGSSVVAADFGKSGYADLAVGAPWESLSDEDSAGRIHVLYGSADGVTATGDQVWSRNTPGVRGTPELFFGHVLTAGDLGGSDRADLVIGVPVESAGGRVQVLYGSASGLSAAGDQIISQDTPGIAGTAEDDDEFGSSVAAGNFNGTGKDDLVVGVPNEGIRGLASIGAIHVLPGTANGLTGTGSQLWTQDSPGIAGVAEDLDYFGKSLSTG